MNEGKRFEAQIKDSVPPNVFYYRFRDGTANFSGGTNDNVRFQQTNLCDCMLFDGKLYLLELKSYKGKSIPLSGIRSNQIKGLVKASTYPGIVAGFLVNFRDLGRTFFISAHDVEYFMAHEERKSIPLAWCEENGIEIQGKRLKVNYRWNLERLLEKLPFE